MRGELFLAALAAVLTAGAADVDGVVAKVNDSVILRSDVVAEMRRAGLDQSNFDKVRNEMIDRKLILKAARDAKLSIQDWVVEGRIREIVNRSFDGDRNKLQDLLRRQKVSEEDWKQQMQEDLVVSAMRWQTIDRTVQPSPRAMREEYEKHPERYTLGRRVTVSVILLKPEDAAKRKDVSDALKEQSFADVARRYSSDGHAAQGGGWKEVDPEKEFRPEVCEEIGRMPTGTMSRWIDLDGWSFLLRKDADDDEKKRTFAEAYDDIEANVRRELSEKKYEEWIDRLRRGSYIKVY